MSDELIIGFDELSALLNGNNLMLDNKEHTVTENSDGTVNILIDPSSSTIVGGSNGLLGESLSEDIYTRLGGFGFTEFSEADKRILALLLRKVKESVRNFTNLNKVPEGLHYKIVDAVCAYFLEMKFVMGALTVEFSAPVSSISEGDTSVSFKVASSPQDMFLTILSGMRLTMSELVRYRVMVW